MTLERIPTPRTRRRWVRDPRQAKTKFLDALREGHSTREAARQSGASRASLFSWRSQDDAFAAAWKEAVQDGDDAIVQERSAGIKTEMSVQTRWQMRNSRRWL